MVPPIRWNDRGGRQPSRQVGFELVPVSVARQAIDEVLAPLVGDMDLVRPHVWARRLAEEQWALLWFGAYKGGSFEVEYGVGCDWVPYFDRKLWRWRRTFKQLPVTLRVDHFTIDAPRTPAINRLGGLGVLRREAEAARDVVGPLATAWWASVASPGGVLAEANRQAQARMTLHWPGPDFVAAFTLAKLGEVQAARERLVAIRKLDDTERDAALTLLDTMA